MSLFQPTHIWLNGTDIVIIVHPHGGCSSFLFIVSAEGVGVASVVQVIILLVQRLKVDIIFVLAATIGVAGRGVEGASVNWENNKILDNIQMSKARSHDPLTGSWKVCPIAEP